jgi:hypothetical protein
MSAGTFLKLVMAAALTALAAAMHSPYADSLATVWADISP